MSHFTIWAGGKRDVWLNKAECYLYNDGSTVQNISPSQWPRLRLGSFQSKIRGYSTKAISQYLFSSLSQHFQTFGKLQVTLNLQRVGNG